MHKHGIYHGAVSLSVRHVHVFCRNK